ncbi:hypothetical protein NL676_004064 [Syzygium grande]|nr:hypothetical protein NL676_004064 [Syzygium grande]
MMGGGGSRLKLSAMRIIITRAQSIRRTEVHPIGFWIARDLHMIRQITCAKRLMLRVRATPSRGQRARSSSRQNVLIRTSLQRSISRFEQCAANRAVSPGSS